MPCDVPHDRSTSTPTGDWRWRCPCQKSMYISIKLWMVLYRFCWEVWGFPRVRYFYTPVFRRDVLWYGDVRPGLRPSIHPSVRLSQFSALFSFICFVILSWNFVYHFILMHVRSSSNAINFRQFLMELCPFWTSHSYKYAVFRTFLIHALTYWAEMLHMTFFYSTSDQVWVSSICKSIFVGVMPLLELTILEIHNFLHFSLTFFDILS